VAVLSIPLAWFSHNSAIIVWFIFEMACLSATACMITILWEGHADWVRAIFILFLLLAWYPVMVDLLYGQLTILLTTLLLAALLSLKKDHNILAGFLIGLTVAIKMIT
jgi:hypothetical protein